ncbi:MAG: GNAT family N-acetyltransferase [Oceanospirillaceae bacterium]|nr:GNAT family N-acetyltransferase [Oceanospirillaceae bacterium]
MIRKLSVNDLDTLLVLCQEHAEYENLPFELSGQRERWQELCFSESPRIYVWVYEQEGQVQGYMSVTIDYAIWSGKPFVNMDCLYLRPTARGHGLGRGFIETLKAFCKQQGCTEMQWHTPPDNQLGIDFYRRIGANEKLKQRFYLNLESDNN